jgi:hypothetical protein
MAYLLTLRTVIFICVTVFMCSPVSAFWDQENFVLLATGKFKYKCMNEGAEIVANGVISTIQVWHPFR